jgi:hypothetical protein
MMGSMEPEAASAAALLKNVLAPIPKVMPIVYTVFEVSISSYETERGGPLQAWLGHRNIQHTVRYTELAPDRFKNFWRD